MSGISRRRFLAGSIAGCAATTLCGTKAAFAAGSFTGYPEGMGVLVDLTRCVGCRSCEAACNKEQTAQEGIPEKAKNLHSPTLPTSEEAPAEEKSEDTKETDAK